METYPDTRSGSRKVPCNVHFVHSYGFAYAVLFSERITYGSSGEQARVPRLQPAWNSPLETYPDMTDIRLI